jgi:hypothetical protein
MLDAAWFSHSCFNMTLVFRGSQHHHRAPHICDIVLLRSIHQLVCYITLSAQALSHYTLPRTILLKGHLTDCSYSILQKRVRGETLPPSRFSLGKFGIAINLFAVLYVTVACIASFFPVVNSSAVADMNWSVVMFGGVLVIACVDYFFRGRKQYIEPAKHLNKI